MVNEREPPRQSQASLMTPGESSVERDDERTETFEEESQGEEYSSPRERNSDSDVAPLPSIHLPPPPLPLTYPIMTEYVAPHGVASSLSEASKIKKLNGPDDWVEWNRSLEGHLGMVDLWEILTGEAPAPAEGTPEHNIWLKNQRKLRSLLLLICGPSALALMGTHTGKSATEQYNVLKDMYNITTISTFGTLYRQIFRCTLSDHKSLKKYGEEVTKAKNKLIELGIPLPELAVTCAFLDGLDGSYKNWKEQFLGRYAENPTKVEKGVKVIVVPTIEDVMSQSLDRESSSSAASKQATTRAFDAKKGDNKNKESSSRDPSHSRPPARGGKSSSSQRPQRYCDTCYSTKHNAAYCWFTHPEKQSGEFKANYPNAEAISKALEDAQKANKEWQKSHPPKGLIAKAQLSTSGEKDTAWYLDSAAGVHLTYHLNDYIHPDLDNQRESVEIANGEKLLTKGAGTIALEVLVSGIPTYVHIHNVHYCPEIDSNLLSLGAFGTRGCEFYTKKGILHVMDKVGDTVLQARCKGQVYPLLQPQTPHYPPPALVHAYKTTKPVTMDLWHQRAGHVNKKDLSSLKNMVFGVAMTDANTSFCEACALGKQHKVHSTEPPTHRATLPGERLHNDLFGGGNTLSGIGGYHYGSVVIDDATRVRFPILLKTKDAICDELSTIINRIETETGNKVKALRTDNGSEFGRLEPYLKERGISHEKSAPYAQDQDGVAERSIRTILERARTMLIHANLPHRLWPEAISAACYITNRLPTKTLQQKTPYEAWYGHKPDLSNLRVYGCDAYVVDYHAKSKGKMAPRSWAGTLVGYEAKNQWRIFDGKTVFVRRDVIFNESNLTYKTKPTPIQPVGELEDLVDLAALLQPVGAPGIGDLPPTITFHVPEAPNNTQPETHLPGDSHLDNALDLVTQLLAEVQEANTTSTPLGETGTNNTAETNTFTDPAIDYTTPPNPLVLEHPRPRTRHDYKNLNTKGFAKKAKPQDVLPKHGIKTPKTYQEAISGPQAKEWRAAMEEKVKSQLQRGTFRITRPPYDERIIPGKWDFKIKENPDGTIARYKARWVAKGYVQVQGRDYDDKFAPVVRSDTTRFLLAVAATRNWRMRQFDIKTAFLNSNMDRKLFTQEPKGYETEEGNACLLNTALYGLVQSANLWFKEIKGTCLEYGLVQSKHDDALFFNPKTELYVTIYVDDIKVFAPTDAIIDQFSLFVSTKYELTDIGDLKWYLGMEINCLQDGSIVLTQSKYIQDLLHRHGMEDCAKASTPISQVQLTKAPENYTCDKEQLKQYQSLLGELMHLMVQTKPDLAYSVSRLAQFMSNPTEQHWAALKRILRYLQGSKDLGNCYKHAPGNLTMSVWTDSSWGEDPDDSRSTNGYLVLMAGGPVAWKSTKQQSVALSSTEAEYMGQTMTATQTMWTRGLLKELQIKGTIPKNATVIFADNQGAIKLAENPIF